MIYRSLWTVVKRLWLLFVCVGLQWFRPSGSLSNTLCQAWQRVFFCGEIDSNLIGSKPTYLSSPTNSRLVLNQYTLGLKPICTFCNHLKFYCLPGHWNTLYSSINLIQMVTVRFEIKPYLAAYMYARYGTPPPIRLSPLEPLYHTLHFFTVPYPTNLPYQRETGNIVFVLPDPRDGKNPEKYNYCLLYTSPSPRDA